LSQNPLNIKLTGRQPEEPQRGGLYIEKASKTMTKPRSGGLFVEKASKL